jgi:hypothetical protein
MILEKYPNHKIEHKGFIEVKGFEGILGASPDDAMISILKINDKEIGIEMKACMNWGTHYDRVACPVYDKQKDFWQLQTEMLALVVDEILYVSSKPPKNVIEVIECDDDEDVKKMIGGIDIISVQASPIHQQSLKHRALLGDQIIKKFLSGVDFLEACQIVCSEFDVEE